VTSSLNAFTASQINKDGTLALVTSSLNAFTQSQIGKDGTLAQVTSSLRYFYQTTSSLHAFTGSQINKDFTLSVVTSSINEFSSSQLANDVRMLYITGALNSFTQSQIGKDGTLAEVTTSLQYFYQTTSSLHAFTASQIGKDGTLSEVTSSLRYFYQTTSSLHAFTSSQINKDGTLALVTSSLNDFTQSQIGKDGTLAVVTSSLNAFTSSQINKDFTLSIVTSSLNNYTSSALGQANTISAFTSSINAFTGSQINKDFTLSVVTSSLNAFTSSQIGKDGTLAIVTSSFRDEIGGIEAYTASLKGAIIVNGSNVQIVGELDVARLNVQYVSSSVLVTSGSNVFGDASNDKHEFTGSVHINDTLFIKGIAQGTGELNAQTASQQNVNGQIGISTGSLNAFTGSQIGKDFTLSFVTSSIDAHILKQATQTGSQDLVNLGISTYTGSQNVINSSVDAHILKQATQTGSQDLVNYNISVYTGSQNVINTSVNSHILAQSTQTGSQDLVNLGISTYTGSQNVINTSIDVHILKQATQTGSQDLVNLGISTFTGSLRSEVNLIEAYTASLKGAAIVSSSQQITNYYKFAETASANTFYGNQTFASSGGSGLRVYGAAGTHQWDVYLNGENLRISDNTVGDAALVVDTRASFTRPVTASALNLTKSPDGIFAELGGNTPKLNLYKFSSGNVMNLGHNYYYDGVAYGKNDVSLQGWEFRSHITNGQYTISHSPAGVTTLNQLTKLDANTGDLTITNGNLVVASGKGIDFSATSNGSGTTSSELLNDYEEGTWSPQIYYQNATDQSNSTNVTQVGTYIKVGNVVTVIGVLQWTVTGSPANDNIGIKNFPFTSKTGADYIWWGNVQLVNAGAYPTDGYILRMDNNTTLTLFYDRRSDAGNYGDDIGASGTKTARFTITYFT
jgi:predicted Fe-Mo cluster-binding NifX family protein